MKISLLIPVRHLPDPLLDTTLASIAAQDHADRETLLLLPAGTPGGDTASEAAGTRRVPVPPGAATGEILNRGLEAAGGEVLAHLEPGERLHPGALTLADGYLTRRPECGALYGEAFGLTADGRTGGPRPAVPFDYDRLRADSFPLRPAVFWRRALLETAGVFEETLAGDAADFDLWLRIAAETPFHHLAGCLLGGGWPVRGRGCGAAAMLEVARQHGADDATIRPWLRRIAAERSGGEDQRTSPDPRVRGGYVGRLLVAAGELGVVPDAALLAELGDELAEVNR